MVTQREIFTQRELHILRTINKMLKGWRDFDAKGTVCAQVPELKGC